MNIKPLKVSDLNKYIKRLLNTDPILYSIVVEGEVSNFKSHYSGNLYFTLKDEKSKLKCVMFSSEAEMLDITIKDGDNLIVKGNISVYERDGIFQLYVKEVKTKGLGQLHIAFETLKKNLEKEGLFDKETKKEIPFIPNKIGVVTSATGAAVKDIITVIKRRFTKMDILIYPVLVQGKTAHMDICKALKYLDSREDVDVIITGRGGGSIEELWAFNEEETARTIHSLKTPIISAVGHETDFTIADFVSDYRAPTPSAAGEIVVPEYYELNYKLDDIFNTIKYLFEKKLEKNRYEINFLSDKLRLNNTINNIKYNKDKIDEYMKRILDNMKHIQERKLNYLEQEGIRLHSFSPLAVMERGYSIIKNEDGDCVNTISRLGIDDKLYIYMKDGNVEAKVTNMYKE